MSTSSRNYIHLHQELDVLKNREECLFLLLYVGYAYMTMAEMDLAYKNWQELFDGYNPLVMYRDKAAEVNGLGKERDKEMRYKKGVGLLEQVKNHW